MKLLNMIKIRTKLLLMSAMLILGIVLVGFIGYYYNIKSNNVLDNIYAENTIAIIKLSDARTQSRANFANILNLMVTTEEAGKKEILTDIADRVTKISDDFTEFEKLSLTDYEKEQYALIKSNDEKWTSMTNQITELITNGETDKAISLFKSSGETIFEDLQTSIRDLVNFNIDEAATTYASNKEDGKRANQLLITLVIVISVVALALGVLITLSITRSISGIVKIIHQTSNLDLQHDESHNVYKNYKDETGAIARSVGELRAALRKLVGNVSAISTNLAASSEELAASTEESTKTINQVVNSINEIAVGNNAQAETIAKASETIVTMAASIDEVNKATETNSANSKRSLEIIDEGQKAIDLTMVKMKETIKVSNDVGESITDLSGQMDKVVSIIDVIGAISEQTNLLSLNASIEAARAGEAGKGFAVVAAEIGKLSKNTAKAVSEITEIVTGAVSRNNETATNIALARDIVAEQEAAILTTMDAFSQIKESVGDIVKRTMEVYDRVKEIDTAAQAVSNQTQDMSAVAEESAASSEEISATNEEQLASIEMIASAANDLSVMATDLNNEISKFKL